MTFNPPIVNPLIVPQGGTTHISFQEFDVNGNAISPLQGTFAVLYSTGNANDPLSTSTATCVMDSDGSGATFTGVAPGQGGVRVSATSGSTTVYASFNVIVPWEVDFVGTTSP